MLYLTNLLKLLHTVIAFMIAYGSGMQHVDTEI